MGTKYSANSAIGYNATPPPDDGTVSEANKTKYSTIKTKLGDPVKALAEAIDTDLSEHFDHGPTAFTSNDTIGASHYEDFIQVSGSGVTLTLTDAATLTGGWNCWICNTDSSNTVTIGRATGGDTINGAASNYTLQPLQMVRVFVVVAANGFRVKTYGDALYNAAGTFSAVQTFTAAPVVRIDDATTNDVTTALTVSHTTSGTPATSIGVGINFEAETSASNNEIGAQVQAIAVDATAASEDFKLSFKTMKAGAAASEAAYVAQGLVVGAPTDGDKGANNVNAAEYYRNGVAMGLPGIIKITSGAATNTSAVDIPMSTYAAYRNKLLRIHLLEPATGGADFQMRTSTDNASTFATSGGDYSNSVGASTDRIDLSSAGGVSSGSDYSAAFDIRMYDMSGTTRQKNFIWEGTFRNSADGVAAFVSGGGRRLAAADIDGIQLLFSSGDVVAIEWTLYAII